MLREKERGGGEEGERERERGNEGGRPSYSVEFIPLTLFELMNFY